MFKDIIYINPLIIFIIALTIRSRISVNIKRSNKKNLKICLIICIIYSILNIILSSLAYWNNDYTGFILFSLILLILTILVCIKSFKLIKEATSINDINKISVGRLLIIFIFPIIAFALPYFYEIYLIKKCDYIFIDEINTDYYKYSALINNKIKDFSLSKFKNESSMPYDVEYSIQYKDNEELKIDKMGKKETNIDNIKNIANDAKERINNDELKKEYNLELEYANIKYLNDSKYTIISLYSGSNNKIILGNYLYKDNNFISKLKKYPGNIIYYNKK